MSQKSIQRIQQKLQHRENMSEDFEPSRVKTEWEKCNFYLTILLQQNEKLRWQNH